MKIIMTEEEFQEYLAIRPESEKKEIQMAGQDMLYNILCTDQLRFILDEKDKYIYPLLWDKMREAVSNIIDINCVELQRMCYKAIMEIIEEEKKNPLQPMEERPVQSPEDIAAGKLNINIIEPDKPVLQVILNETLKEYSTSEECVNHVIEQTATEFGDTNIDCELYGNTIKENMNTLAALVKPVVTINELDVIASLVKNCSSDRYAEKFIWNLYQMPQEIKDMIGNLGKGLENMASGYMKLSDPAKEYIDKYKEDNSIEELNEEQYKEVIENILLNSGKVIHLFSNVLNAMTSSKEFIKCLILEKMEYSECDAIINPIIESIGLEEAREAVYTAMSAFFDPQQKIK